MRAAFESPKFHYPINISPHCESGRASMGSCWLLLPIRYHRGRASMRTRAAPSPMQINGQTNEEKKSARTTPAGWMVELNRDPEQSVRHHRPGRVPVLALGPSPINWIDHTRWDTGIRDVHHSKRFKLRTRKDLGTAVIGWFVFRWWWWTCRWFCYYVVPVTGSLCTSKVSSSCTLTSNFCTEIIFEPIAFVGEIYSIAFPIGYAFLPQYSLLPRSIDWNQA